MSQKKRYKVKRRKREGRTKVRSKESLRKKRGFIKPFTIGELHVAGGTEKKQSGEKNRKTTLFSGLTLISKLTGRRESKQVKLWMTNRVREKKTRMGH